MKRWSAIAACAAAAATGGCGSVDGGSVGSGADAVMGCSPRVSSRCPSRVPKYRADVAPILSTYCTGCHAPGGEESNLPLDDYSDVSSLATDIEGVLGECFMPPTSASQPSRAQRDTILDWIACGAPDN